MPSAMDQSSGCNSIQEIDTKLIVIMVGLPARGKSYIVKKLARYLNWLQINTRIFNAGVRRRIAASASQQQLSSASFFDPSDSGCVAMRDSIALDTLDGLLQSLESNESHVGILDATNSTIGRRRLIMKHIQQNCKSIPDILFLESSTSDTQILQRNSELKLFGPDYRGHNQETALSDFLRRMAHYESTYVPLGMFEEQKNIPYVRMIDVGRKMETHLIHGFMSTQIVDYLLNFNLAERQIWISCNGESQDDSVYKIGRRSSLTDHGRQYAAALETFVSQRRQAWDQAKGHRFPPLSAKDNEEGRNGEVSLDDYRNWCYNQRRPDLAVWTSSMPQATETAPPFTSSNPRTNQVKALDDLNAGGMAGLTFEEIEQLHSKVFAARQSNRLFYRWPGLGGEAYIDVINRLRPIIIDLKLLKHHVLLITHRAVVRVLLGYFLGMQKDNLAAMKISKDSVFCLEPKHYGINCQIYTFVPESGDFVQIHENIYNVLEGPKTEKRN